MSKLTVTNFTKRTGSPFQKAKETQEDIKIVHEEVIEKTTFEKQKEKQNELIQKVTKKTAEYQSNKPSSGVFTEVVSHGAFTSKNRNTNTTANATPIAKSPTPPKSNGSNGSKSLLGFPSSANDLALDAKTDLESDPNISKAVKDKVIEKLFALVSMVQHTYESKVRIMTEFEKYKDTHTKNEIRREKEHSEQLYKLNMNFQNEVVQAIQRLKSELDITRNVSENIEDRSRSGDLKDTSDFNVSGVQELDLNEQGEDTVDLTLESSNDRVESENNDSDALKNE
ncbi:uncharacterized protein LOC111357172 [Spodoptera litura]|uniref:Uncharacterized protein LOC111357172 n=1 Tax=Spodoptera litura TaxID=69820 RepID=A0A9J7EF50_SPOLT|nr:uncharacterized protein LOC111357172 [Spodoptera litura]